MSSSIVDRGARNGTRSTGLDTLRSVLEGSPDPALVVDAGGRVRCASPAVRARLGWTQEELLASSLDTLLPDRGALGRIAQAARTHGAHTELELRHRDGSRLRTSISVTPLRLPDFAGALLFLHDPLGHRRLVEAERKSTELEQTARAISHDLRSPLVAVLGFSRLLREDYEALLDEKGRHFLERIEQAARTMESLIRDFLEFSRIDHERERPGVADPREVLVQLQAELKPRLETARIRLELPSDAPLIHCERTRLYQIFSNLIGNALDHMGPASEPWIRVRILEEPRHHHIVVLDNGTGIDPAQHQSIFEPFRGRRCEGLEGTGIGLAIVRKIAEVHGGRAWVESRSSQGAAFHVTLRRP